MNFRPAQPLDAPKLAQVHVDSWQVAYKGIVPDAFLRGFTYQKREKAFRLALESKSEETYFIEEDDRAVGILTIGASRDEDLDPSTCGEIWGIYISPDYWRCGIGRRLVQEAERILQSRGFQKIVLWVLEGNTAARSFYEVVGYDLDGATREVELGVSLNVVRYAKVLQSVK